MVAGLIVVVFGLVFMGLLPFPWLERLVVPELVEGARRRGSRALLGGAFGVCAAPCIGPVLASILALASEGSTAAEGSLLLLVYSVGLAVPFLLVGVGFDRVMGASRWLRDRYGALRVASGGVLVGLGLLLFFDRFWWLNVVFNHVRILWDRGLGGPGAALEPSPRSPDCVGASFRPPRQRAPLDLVEPGAHPRDRVGIVGEFVPAGGSEGNGHVHLPQIGAVGDRLPSLALEPRGNGASEAGGQLRVRS
jgi:hypothetical protein